MDEARLEALAEETEFPALLKMGMQVPLRAEVTLGELAPEDGEFTNVEELGSKNSVFRN